VDNYQAEYAYVYILLANDNLSESYDKYKNEKLRINEILRLIVQLEGVNPTIFLALKVLH
jgi:hypothetical protein